MQSQIELRAAITTRIIEALKQGTIPWRKPWRGIDGPRLPTNLVTGRPYSGLNIPLLWLAGQQRNYPVDLWGSFNQFKSIGAHVRKGEKATQIVFFKPVTRRVRDKYGEEREESFPLLRTWSVFNVAQVEGEAVKKYQEEPGPLRFDPSDRSEFDRTVAATGADIRYGGDKAVYFRPPLDYIQVPHEGRFESFPAFAETVAHELVHWSEARTGWIGDYAEGELRAELGAVFFAAALGIPDSGDLTNHASYLASWLQALENDPKFIFRASSAASKAVAG